MTNKIQIVATAKDEVSGPLAKMRDNFDTLGKTAGFKAVAQGVGVGVGISAMGLLSSGIGKVTEFLQDSITAYNDEQKSIAGLNASLKANVASWDGNTNAIEAVLAKRRELAFSDDEQRTSLAGLVGATHDVNKALEIERTAMDLARFKNISLADASDALTKVEAGSYRILKSLGIVLKDGATQTDALAAVQAVAMGAAAAYADTNEGKLAKSFDTVHEAQEKFGKGLSDLQVTVLPAAAGAVSDFARDLDKAAADWQRDTTAMAKGAEDFGQRLNENAPKVGDASDWVVGSAKKMDSSWDDATNSMVTNVEHMRGEFQKNFAAIPVEVDAASVLAQKIAASMPHKIASSITAGWGDVRTASQGLMDAMKHPISGINRDKALQAILDGKSSVGKKMIAGLKSADPLAVAAAQKLKDDVTAELAALRHVNFIFEATSVFNRGRKPKQKALGGPVSAGETYLVGEQGPEFFTPRVSGGITPHGGGGGGNTFHVHFHAQWPPTPQHAQEVVRFIRDKLATDRELASYSPG